MSQPDLFVLFLYIGNLLVLTGAYLSVYMESARRADELDSFYTY